MTSGKIHQQVVEEITHYNEKNQIPFENYSDGKRIAKLLFDKKYPYKQIDNDIQGYHVVQLGKTDTAQRILYRLQCASRNQKLKRMQGIEISSIIISLDI